MILRLTRNAIHKIRDLGAPETSRQRQLTGSSAVEFGPNEILLLGAGFNLSALSNVERATRRSHEYEIHSAH